MSFAEMYSSCFYSWVALCVCCSCFPRFLIEMDDICCFGLQVICSVCDTEQPVHFLSTLILCRSQFFPTNDPCIHLSLSCPGCMCLCELWCQYGRVFLRNLQILWWWCNLIFNFSLFSICFLKIGVPPWCLIGILTLCRLRRDSFIVTIVGSAGLRSEMSI